MEPDSLPDYVVATYEEIRARFGLGGTDQARIKAKRRKWPAEPPNHPGALAQIRLPRKDWDAAGQREAAKVAAAAAEGEAKGLRLALEEARRPSWRRWLG
jgi:hypothetical protein